MFSGVRLSFAERKNGQLLSLAEAAKYDIFLTLDQGIAYQQNLGGRDIAVVNFAREIEPRSGPRNTDRPLFANAARREERVCFFVG